MTKHSRSIAGLLSRVTEGRVDRRRLGRAIAIAFSAHRGVARRDGTPYVHHVLWVALWTALHPRTDPETILAALLHDVLEDAPSYRPALYRVLSPKGMRTVEALTRHGHGPLAEAAYLWKLTVAMRRSPGVALIKACDCAHNLLTPAPSDSAYRRNRAKAMAALLWVLMNVTRQHAAANVIRCAVSVSRRNHRPTVTG